MAKIEPKKPEQFLDLTPESFFNDSSTRSLEDFKKKYASLGISDEQMKKIFQARKREESKFRTAANPQEIQVFYSFDYLRLIALKKSILVENGQEAANRICRKLKSESLETPGCQFEIKQNPPPGYQLLFGLASALHLQEVAALNSLFSDTYQALSSNVMDRQLGALMALRQEMGSAIDTADRALINSTRVAVRK